MKLGYLPWLALLLAGIVYALVSEGTLHLVVGIVMALSGLLGWVNAVKRYRAEPQQKGNDRH